MPAATKKRPPMKAEPGEGKLHEKGESPEEETREGAELDDAPRRGSKTNRKRSAKNANSTKAPMDGDCGCGGKKGASCDGNCGGYAKKMDALTPQEYLAACELGIQSRSRSYIRARLDTAMNLTPSTIRADLKCGNGSISQGEKCHKGAAQKAQSTPGRIERRGWYGTSGLGGDPFSYKNMAKKGAMVNAAVGGGYGAALGSAIGGRSGALLGAGAGAALGAAAGALSGAAQAGLNRATSNAAKRRRLTREFEAPIAKKFKAKRAAMKQQMRSHDMKTAMKLAQGYDRIHQQTKGRYGADSVYAPGFTPDLAQLAL